MSDFAKSTQLHKWTFTKEALVSERDDPKFYTRARLFLFDELTRFATKLSMRQRVLATAQVYLSRVLTRIGLCEINPYLLMATVLYVAGRAEEQPVHMRTVCLEARQLWPNYMPVEVWQLAECEFYVLAELETCLLVHHPYSSLMRLSADMCLASAETQACWAAINDSYATDVPLIYSPGVVAFTAIYMVLVLKPGLIPNRPAEQVKRRLDSLSRVMGAREDLDLKALVGCVQEFLSLYALRKNYQANEAAEKLKEML